MLREYLEDIEVAYQNRAQIDQNTLQHITQRMLGMGGRKVPDKLVPELLRSVLANLSSLGDWVQAANKGGFKQHFRRNVYVRPWHDIEGFVKIAKSQKQKDKKRVAKLKNDEFLGEYMSGGEIYFYAAANMNKGRNQLYSEFGYYFEVRKQPILEFTNGIYALFSWKPWKDGDRVEVYLPLKSFPNEERAQKTLRKCLKRAKAAALKQKNCPKTAKQILRQFNIP
jgi:hypothetical protein